MRKLRARQLAEQLAAAYPGRSVQLVNVEAWQNNLLGLDEETGISVVGKLIHRAADPPSVAQLLQCVDEVEQTTFSPRSFAPESGRGITFAEYLEQRPDMVERARKVFPSWFKANDPTKSPLDPPEASA